MPEDFSPPSTFLSYLQSEGKIRSANFLFGPGSINSSLAIPSYISQLQNYLSPYVDSTVAKTEESSMNEEAPTTAEAADPWATHWSSSNTFASSRISSANAFNRYTAIDSLIPQLLPGSPYDYSSEKLTLVPTPTPVARSESESSNSCSPALASYISRYFLYFSHELEDNGVSLYMRNRRHFYVKAHDWHRNLHQLRLSRTLYLGNVDINVEEKHFFEGFRRLLQYMPQTALSSSVVDKITIGLNKIDSKPCGFSFVFLNSPQAAIASQRFLSQILSLLNKPIKVDVDIGFEEGRQYGRGQSGQQTRNDVQSQRRFEPNNNKRKANYDDDYFSQQDTKRQREV